MAITVDEGFWAALARAETQSGFTWENVVGSRKPPTEKELGLLPAQQITLGPSRENRAA